MDMEKLDFINNSFDFAYSSLAIEYTNDWVKVLKETYRILKPGSKFVFSCNHPIETASDYFKNNKNHGALLGRETNNNSNKMTIYGDYLAADSGGIRQVVSILPGSYAYHRPISKMIEDIIESGFTICKLVEPLPVEEMKIKFPDKYKKLRKIPVFIIWVLQKGRSK
jgi:ubiquinone/menaquinone biosynthesis C-methylase UbiE